MQGLNKRALSWLLVLALLLNMLPAAALAAEGGAAAAEVYRLRNDVALYSAAEAVEIGSAADLKLLQNAAEGAVFRLAADIELPADWQPITMGYNDGVMLDGAGYTITLNGSPVFETMYSLNVSNLILDGQVTGDTNIASLAKSGYGTVRNCVSYADITYTGKSDNWGSLYYVAGLVAKINENSGVIQNCVYAGRIDLGSALPGYGAIANFGVNKAGQIKNCLGVGSDRLGSATAYNSSFDEEASPIETGSNSLIANAADFDPADYVAQLNQRRDAAAGDMEWEVRDGRLALKQAEALPATEEEVAALQEAVSAANAVDKNKIYTGETWQSFSEALAKAENILSQAEKQQAAVVNAAANLNSAVGGLAERPLAAVDFADKEVISITSVSGLENMQSGKYYRLDADLEIQRSDYYFPFGTLDFYFDGNGHTITLGKADYLWQGLGANAVVQNLGVKGGASSQNNAGAIAQSSRGLIINCWSQANVTTTGANENQKHTGGLVGELKSGGAIVNCYVTGNVVANGSLNNGSAGAFAGSSEANSLIKSCYKQDTVTQPFAGVGGAQIRDCQAMTRQDFYSPGFIALLNANRGGGREWSLSAAGYPHLGEAQSYTPPEAVRITFTYHDGREVEFGSDEGLQVSLQDAVPEGLERYKLGSFSIAGQESAWRDMQTGNKDILLVTESGELSIYKPGSVEVEGGGVRFLVTVVAGDEIAGFRLAHNGEAVGERLVLQGSERATLVPQIKRTEAGAWQTIAASQVRFSHTGSLRRVSNSFYAEEPGEMTLTAEYMGRSVTVNIVSEFVAVTSITPAPGGEYVIHQRNPNSSGLGDFLDLNLSHGAGAVIVEPENASYRDRWTMTSSDPATADYVASMLRAVLPKKAGAATLTAVVEADGRQPRVEGSSQITLRYFNPVQAVTIAEGELSVKENAELKLPLTFTGPQSPDGWRVSEPAMAWSFEGAGEARIVRDGELGIWEETANGKVCEANDQYKLIGVKAGELKVTGTPLDQTLAAAPVVFTVRVEAGDELPPADNGALAAAGIAAGQSYLAAKAPEAYVFGDEWEIFALRRSGQSVAPDKVAAYLDSVAAAYRKIPDSADLKPTTLARVVLALGALGENAADFRGLDFIDMLCRSDQIGSGGNEPMWTLIALDSRGFAEPPGAPWSRDKLISELILGYQNPEGGFGLNDNVTAGVDMTAMAVQALAPYYESRQDVRQAVDRALEYLRGRLGPDCGFDGNVEAAAQVVLALTALDRDLALPENGFAAGSAANLLTNITGFEHEEGGYKHFISDRGAQKMSTIQALLAFEAYRRWAAGESFLYDLEDVNRLSVLRQRLAEAERLRPADYTADSWQAVAEAAAEAGRLLAGAYTEADLQRADAALAAAIAALQPVRPDSGGSNPVAPGRSITVSFRLIGDSQHDGAASHDKYINWIKTMNVTVPEDSTVYDVLAEALAQKGMDFEEGQEGYISSIQAPAALGGYWLAEFDNGPGSGWKYLVNGKYPNVGLRYYWPKNGDRIIWRYVDDYTDAQDNGNKWQEAADVDPNPAMGGGGISGASGEKTSVIAPAAKLDKNGAAVSSVTYKEIAGAIKQAQKDGARTVTVMPQSLGSARNIAVSLTADSARELAKAELGVNIETGRGSLALGEEALLAIAEQAAGSDLRFNIEAKDTKTEAVKNNVTNALQQAANLRGAAESLLANACVTEVTITSDNKAITGFGGHQLILNLPVNDKSFTKGESYKVVVVSADGAVETVSGQCLLVGGRLVVQVRIGHLSTFIVLDEKAQAADPRSAMSFADVTEANWFYEAVRFVYEAGLMNGENENRFMPNGSLSRAMLVTILYRLENQPEVTADNKFSDVKAGRWYSEAVGWAGEQGIVNGYEDGTFKPDSSVSREEMAAVLARYAEYKGLDVSAAKDLSGYNDSAKVAGWAAADMAWANAVGLIQGDESNRLNPQAKATRAEAAAILMRLVTNVLK